jgi:hypothetical protein
MLDYCFLSRDLGGFDMVSTEQLKAIGILSLIVAGTVVILWQIMGSVALPVVGILFAAYWNFVYKNANA